MYVDAHTLDVLHNTYLCQVQKKVVQLYNVEFDVNKDVKDPGKTK